MPAAILQRGRGDSAHQADRTAAVNQADAAFGKSLPESLRCFDELGIGTGA